MADTSGEMRHDTTPGSEGTVTPEGPGAFIQGDEPIVVGYGGGRESDAALDWSIEAARRVGRPLRIVHCYDLAHVPVLAAMVPDENVDLTTTVASKIAEEARQRAAAVLGDDRVTAESALGSPAGELIEASKAAYFVVTGTHGKGRLRAGLLGSTSYTVTAHANCPAVVVRSEAAVHSGPDRRVVVGVDDSEQAERALDAAVRVARASGATLHLVRVLNPPIDPRSHADLAPMFVERSYALDEERLQRALHDAASDTCRETADRVRQAHPALSVTWEVLEGNAGLALSQVAEGAGLVVVGSRGRGGFTGMLLGSVSHTVIHHAPCPVMVIR